MVHGQFNSHHICCIRQIAGLPRFTGIASIGVSVDVIGDGVEAPTEQNVGQRDDDKEDGQEFMDLQEDQEDQEEEEQLDNDILDILTVAMDNTQLSHR